MYLKAVLLAVVEGITEFLPISSTGHLIILEEYIRLSPDEAFADAFMVVIQLPAILAVVVYFWKELWPFAGTAAERGLRWSLWGKILAAFVPAAVAGLLLGDWIEARLFSSVPVAVALLAGGIVLLVIEWRGPAGTLASVHEMGYRTAVGIGVIQCLALFPGTSRSAATIIGAMLLGANRPTAAEFSFFLAIPTMVGATGYTLLKKGLGLSAEQWGVVAVGSAVSFLVALGAVAFLMNYVRHRDFRVFGYYRIVLAAVVLAYFAWLG